MDQNMKHRWTRILFMAILFVIAMGIWSQVQLARVVSEPLSASELAALEGHGVVLIDREERRLSARSYFQIGVHPLARLDVAEAGLLRLSPEKVRGMGMLYLVNDQREVQSLAIGEKAGSLSLSPGRYTLYLVGKRFSGHVAIDGVGRFVDLPEAS